MQNENQKNTLDCDQSNYSSHIVFSFIPIEVRPSENSAFRYADPENPTVEPNIKWIGWSVADGYRHSKFSKWVVGRPSLFGRQ